MPFQTPAQDLAFAAIDLRASIPDTAYVQPCAAIAPESYDRTIGYLSIADRYGALTDRLPLAGAAALRPIGEDLAIVRHLRQHVPWCGPAIELLDQQLRLQLWAGRPWFAMRPMLLVGPPGAGKSHFARMVAVQAGCGHAVLDFAGTSDSRALEGTARGWTHTQPCFPAVVMARHRTANPLIVIEEVDKAGGSPQGGDPLAVLLTMLERGTAAAYHDKCLLADVDLSHVSWVLTANSLEGLPLPLLSRLDVVEVSGPEPCHFEDLVRDILQDLSRRWAMPTSDMPSLHPGAVSALRQRFTQHRSARQLGREVEAALAAAVRLVKRAPH